MTKIIALLTLLFVVSIGYSQQHDSRLLERYSTEELDELQQENPTEYQVLHKALEKAIFIGPIPTEKGSDVQFDGELEIDPNEEHTFISLGITLKENEYQYFKIQGTNQMVGVLPKSLIK